MPWFLRQTTHSNSKLVYLVIASILAKWWSNHEKSFHHSNINNGINSLTLKLRMRH